MDRGLGSRFGYSFGSSNPFNQSGIVTDRTTPRSHMAKRSIGYRSSTKKRSTGRVVSKKRVVATRKKSNKKTSKRKRVATGSFRKPKRVKRVSVKYHKHRYEQEAKITKASSNVYVKTNDQYTRDAVFMAMSDAVLRPVLAKYCKFYPLQDSDVLDSGTGGNHHRLAFDFKRVKTNGQNVVLDALATDQTVQDQTVLLTDRSYDQMREDFSAMLKTYADCNVSASGTSPPDDTVAYFPYKLRVLRYSLATAAATAEVINNTFEHLGETMLDLKFSQKVSFLNKTKNDSNDSSLTTSGQNPLKGKIYQFSHMEPRLLDHFTTSSSQVIQDNESLGVFVFNPTEAELQHPLDAKYWLKNCTKESSIYMRPGSLKSHSTTKQIKGKLSSLIERLYYSYFDKGSFGCSSMFMFDMVNHSLDNAGNQVNLELEYKRTCLVQSYGKLKQPKIYIPDFDTAQLDGVGGFDAIP